MAADKTQGTGGVSLLDAKLGRPVPIGQSLALIVSAVVIRIVLEYVLESQKVIEPPASFFLFLAYFLAVLSGIALILHALGIRPAQRVLSRVALFSPIIWVPPFLDFALSGGKGFTLLFVFSPPPLVSALVSACSHCPGISDGLRVEVALAVVAVLATLYWATREPVKAAVGALLTYGWVLLHALLPGLLMGWFHHPLADVYVDRELLSFYGLVIGAAAWVLFRESVSFRGLRTLHYSGMAVLGAVLGIAFWNHPLPGAWLPLASLLGSVVCAFYAAVNINDACDVRIDRKRRIQDQAGRRVQAGGAFALSMILGLCAGYGAWIWVLFAFCLSVVYSVPPLRLRRHVALASLVLAACTLAVVVAGFSVGFLDQESAVSKLPFPIMASVFLFIFLASPFKDIKDAQGDASDGVFTLATWLGPDNARAVSSFLVLASVLLVTWISGLSVAVGAVLGLCAAAAVAWIRDWERMEAAVFALDFLFIAALALHWSGILGPF